MSGRREVEVEVEGRRLRLSNLHKLFYESARFTKADVIDYYARIAPALLPHLRDRPLTLKRYPDGAQGPFFYEKRCPSHRPSWVATRAVAREEKGGSIRFCVVNDLATLVWVANLADLEMHTYLHRAPRVEQPTAMVFDLDPGPPADLLRCCEVALLVRRLCEGLGLESFPKTSGAKGLQVYLPLNTPTGYPATKQFARAVAELLARERPDLVVSSMAREHRKGKVLIDWSQNDQHKTTVCAWSLRAMARPMVSTPLSWSEVETAFRLRDAASIAFDAAAALERFRRGGDPFAEVLTKSQQLPDLQALRQGPTREKFRGAGPTFGSGAAPPPAPGHDERRARLVEDIGGGPRRQQVPPSADTGKPPGPGKRPHSRPRGQRTGGRRSTAEMVAPRKRATTKDESAMATFPSRDREE